ncbi:hypothetical protein CPB85DRAFT_1441388 [Mucidula mucida]|nr:hypothetical protein CPB85DRAFT_1441379 [Mucidula mucida]KAF8889479.1 hypothetical protein CPB85DRAFT_1441388 [Mucidula mucida]
MPVHSLPPTKKRRIEKDTKVLQSIQELEQQLTRAVENNASLNPLADLLEYGQKDVRISLISKAVSEYNEHGVLNDDGNILYYT